ncbi:hypothetical protein DPX16_4817 [Anabarilius grahami]|uniref:Uncharacterized protein n=1 Tax=Anabarilius grahami TaxID=495550 RepID=A0A3N0ZA87_ANAGA|nr:hypothetical protein DPX16_4817 [Anabarilius grahami]
MLLHVCHQALSQRQQKRKREGGSIDVLYLGNPRNPLKPNRVCAELRATNRLRDALMVKLNRRATPKALQSTAVRHISPLWRMLMKSTTLTASTALYKLEENSPLSSLSPVQDVNKDVLKAEENSDTDNT